MNNWVKFLILFLISAVVYHQSFKTALNNSKNNGAFIALISILSGIISIILIPFFPLKFEIDIKKIILLIITCILYAIVNRLNTYVRKYIDVSIFAILRLLSNVIMIFMGLIFFKEKFILNKFIGAILIIFSNLLVLYDGKKNNDKKIIIISIIANILFALTLFLNVNLSKSFNIPTYVSIILIIPGIFICIFEKKGIKALTKEMKEGSKKAILLASISSALTLIFQLKAYSFGQVALVSSLCSLNVILNVLFAYFIHNEKNNLLRKIIASIIVIISIFLIKM